MIYSYDVFATLSEDCELVSLTVALIINPQPNCHYNLNEQVDSVYYTLAEYQFSTARGQIVDDLTGNGFTIINGLTVEADDQDAVFTDRGAYLKGRRCLVLASPTVTQSTLDFARPLTIHAWISIASPTWTLLESSQLCVSGTGSKVNVELSSSSSTYSFEKLPKVYINNEAVTESISEEWGIFDGELMKIGTTESQDMDGYIYSLVIFDGLIPATEYEAFAFLVIPDSSECTVHPPESTGCLAANLLPTTNSEGVECTCDTLSCLTEASDCITCDTACSGYCEVTAPYECIPLESLCNGAEFDTSTLSCNWDSSCSANCLSCNSAEGCIDCEAGYYLEAGLCLSCGAQCLSCTGPSGCAVCADTNQEVVAGDCVCIDSFYLTTEGLCGTCDSSCATCSGPLATDCLTCTAENAAADAGTCTCIAGTFAQAADPLQCVECPDSCSICTVSECAACTTGAVPEGCECNEGFRSFEQSCYQEYELPMRLEDSSVLVIASEHEFEFDLNMLEVTAEAFGVKAAVKTANATYIEVSLDFDSTPSGLLTVKVVEEKLTEDNYLIVQTEDTFTIEASEELSAESWGESTSIGITSGGLAIGITSFFTFDDPQVIWTIANTAQLISYLPLTGAPMSEDLHTFFTSYNTMRFLPNPFAEWLPAERRKPPSRYQKFGLSKGEFKDTHSLRNAARYLCIFTLALAIYFLAWLGKFILPHKKLRNSASAFANTFAVGMMKLWIYLQLDMLVAVSVTVCVSDPSGHSSYSLLPALVIATFALLCPVRMLLFICIRVSNLQAGEEIAEKECVNVFSSISPHSKLAFFYEPVYNLRRAFYAFSLYFMSENPLNILGAQVCLGILMGMFVLIIGVYKNRQITNTAALAELVFCLTLCGLIADTVLEKPREEIELAIILLNIGFILSLTLINVTILILRLIRWCRRKKQVQPIGAVVEISEQPKAFEVSNSMLEPNSSYLRQDSATFFPNSISQDPVESLDRSKLSFTH